MRSACALSCRLPRRISNQRLHLHAPKAMTAGAAAEASTTVYGQAMLTLPAAKRGFHIITNRVVDAVKEDLARIDVGLAHVFIQHTSASLILNENADPDVRADFETWTRLAIPEGDNAPWVHTDEGHDDMPAHIKAAMFGSSLTLPITNGRINLGTWQGIWLAEHRNNGGPRQLVITVQGQAKRS